MLPEHIKAVVFDVDGTLIDSLDAWAESDRIFLSERGIAYDPKISEKLKTLHYESAARFLRDEYCPDMTLDAVMSRIDEIIRNKYFNEIPLKPFAAEFMAKCAENGIKMCAATSNLRPLAEGALSSLKILPMLEFILTSDEVGSGKDDPLIFLKCAEKLGASPAETAVFEDSLHAAASAAGAGFYTVAVFDAHCGGEFEEMKKICSAAIIDFGELL